MHGHAGSQDIATDNAILFQEGNFVDASFFGKFINCLVKPGVHFGHTETTIGTTDGMVGVNTNTVIFDVRNIIWSGTGVATGTGDIHAILGGSAAVPVHGVFERKQVAFFVAANFDVGG